MVLSIIITCYNEAGTIKDVIRQIKTVVLPFGMNKKIVIIDDCSTDGSADILADMEKKEMDVPIKIIRHSKNMGKGAALRTGVGVAEGDFVVFQDADVELNPNDYNSLLEPLVSGEADMTLGNRFSKLHNQLPRSYYKYYLANRIINIIFNLLFFFDIGDVNCGYKMFKFDVIKKINIASNSFEVEVEIVAKVLRMGKKIIEMPVSYHPRAKQSGKKIRFKHAFRMVWSMLKYRFSGFIF